MKDKTNHLSPGLLQAALTRDFACLKPKDLFPHKKPHEGLGRFPASRASQGQELVKDPANEWLRC